MISAITWKNCSSPDLTILGFRSSSIWKTPAEFDIFILMLMGFSSRLRLLQHLLFLWTALKLHVCRLFPLGKGFVLFLLPYPKRLRCRLCLLLWLGFCLLVLVGRLLVGNDGMEDFGGDYCYFFLVVGWR